MHTTAVETTDHAARHPKEDIEMLRAQHLTNALRFIGNAIRKPLAPSIKRGPQKFSPIAGHNELATDAHTGPRLVPFNNLGNIDDPHDLPPAGDITAAEDAIDPSRAPVVSLGQGPYRTDYSDNPALERVRDIALGRGSEAMKAVYEQCANLARLPREILAVTDIEAKLSLRVVGHISAATCASLTDPAEPAAFHCWRVYLSQAMHEQILTDFAKKLYASGMSASRVGVLVETLNAVLSPVHMDAIDDAELASINDAALEARYAR